MRTPAALAGALLALAAATGCGGGEAAERPRGAEPPAGPGTQGRGDSRPPPAPARCPAGSAGCRSVHGRVLYVERVDPDGDGDAHFVLLSRQSVTAPGISVVDVRRGLRPQPLPGRGARISAAGPVHRGSHGQRQVEAVSVKVHRR